MFFKKILFLLLFILLSYLFFDVFWSGESDFISPLKELTNEDLNAPFDFKNYKRCICCESCLCGFIPPNCQKIPRREATNLVDKVFAKEGITLEKKFILNKKGERFYLDGYNQEMKIGYVWYDDKIRLELHDSYKYDSFKNLIYDRQRTQKTMKKWIMLHEARGDFFGKLPSPNEIPNSEQREKVHRNIKVNTLINQRLKIPDLPKPIQQFFEKILATEDYDLKWNYFEKFIIFDSRFPLGLLKKDLDEKDHQLRSSIIQIAFKILEIEDLEKEQEKMKILSLVSARLKSPNSIPISLNGIFNKNLVTQYILDESKNLNSQINDFPFEKLKNTEYKNEYHPLVSKGTYLLREHKIAVILPSDQHISFSKTSSFDEKLEKLNPIEKYKLNRIVNNRNKQARRNLEYLVEAFIKENS